VFRETFGYAEQPSMSPTLPVVVSTDPDILAMIFHGIDDPADSTIRQIPATAMSMNLPKMKRLHVARLVFSIV